jgi:alkylresorcinol/alkylpyrone synthase
MATRVQSLATALPKHVITREVTREGLVRTVPPHTAGRYLGMIEASGIDTRASVLPVEELFRLGDVGARNTQYVDHAIALGEEVSRRALADAKLAAGDVDVFVTASCTGYMMPSLEARLAPRLGTSPDVRRVPLTELGCSAGAASLGLASDLLAGGRSRNALVLSVELSSLCLQTTELETMDVVGALLFGDGAAAAVVSADATRGLEIVGSRSILWPNSLEELGMRLTPTGLRLGLSTALVRLVRGNLRKTVDDFLARHGVALRDLRFFAMHPGGPSILKAVAEALELVEGAIRPSWDVWHRCGNMSSATVFFILDEIARTAPPKPGDLGLALAFGPGVSCELVLLLA